MLMAVMGLAIEPDHLLIDAMRIDHPCQQTKLFYGDALSLSIAAASVVAKVHRDALMRELDLMHPGYGLASHKGYGTPEHRRALAEIGPVGAASTDASLRCGRWIRMRRWRKRSRASCCLRMRTGGGCGLGLKLMCVVAHPDDECFAFGGALALAADRGIETYVVCLTDGQAAKNRGSAASGEELGQDAAG